MLNPILPFTLIENFKSLLSPKALEVVVDDLNDPRWKERVIGIGLRVRYATTPFVAPDLDGYARAIADMADMTTRLVEHGRAAVVLLPAVSMSLAQTDLAVWKCLIIHIIPTGGTEYETLRNHLPTRFDFNRY